MVSTKRQNFLFWLLICYLFFEIVRPADVYPFLASIRVQLWGIIILILATFIQQDKRLPCNKANSFLFSFTIILCFSSLSALNSDIAWDVTYNYLKVVLLYFIILYCIKDSFYLKSFIQCFFLLMTLYIALSLREYLLGKHVYVMGVRRMLGWDGQISPNRLGMLCVCFMPFAFLALKNESFVALSIVGKKIISSMFIKIIAIIYILIATVSVFLTNSRTSIILLCCYFLLFFLRFKKRFYIIVIMGCLIPLIPQMLNFLPDASVHRYKSILYTVGLIERDEPMSRADESSENSAQGRIFGLIRGLEIFREYPLLGVGPGGFQYISGNNLQAHNLLGQAASETGTLGMIMFIGLLFSGFQNLKKKNYDSVKSDLTIFSKNLRTTILDSMYLLLIGSIFSHTLFYSWWLFLIAMSVMNKEFT